MLSLYELSIHRHEEFVYQMPKHMFRHVKKGKREWIREKRGKSNHHGMFSCSGDFMKHNRHHTSSRFNIISTAQLK